MYLHILANITQQITQFSKFIFKFSNTFISNYLLHCMLFHSFYLKFLFLEIKCLQFQLSLARFCGMHILCLVVIPFTIYFLIFMIHLDLLKYRYIHINDNDKLENKFK